MMRFLMSSSVHIQSPRKDLIKGRRLLAVLWKIRLYSTYPPSGDSRLPPPCPYKMLGIEETASWKKVREAYLLLAKQLHPDATSVSAAAAPAGQPAVAAQTTTAKVGRRDGQVGAAAAARHGSSSAQEKKYFPSFFSCFGVKKELRQSLSAARTFEDIHWAYETIKTQLQQQKQQQNIQRQFHGSEDWVDRWVAVEKDYQRRGTATGEHVSGSAAVKHQQQQERDEALKEWLARQKAAANFWKERYTTNDTFGAAAAAHAVARHAIPHVAATDVADFSPAVESVGTPQPPTAAASSYAAASSFAATSLGADPYQHPGDTGALWAHAPCFEEAFKRRLQAEKQTSFTDLSKSSPHASNGVYSEFDGDDMCERGHNCNSRLHQVLAKVCSTQNHINLFKQYMGRQDYGEEVGQCNAHMGIKGPLHDTETCAALRKTPPFARHKENFRLKRSTPKTDTFPAATCRREYARDRQQHIRDLQHLGFSEEEIRSAVHVLGVFPYKRSAKRCFNSEKWCSPQERTQQLLCAFFMVITALLGAWSIEHSERRRLEHIDTS